MTIVTEVGYIHVIEEKKAPFCFLEIIIFSLHFYFLRGKVIESPL